MQPKMVYLQPHGAGHYLHQGLRWENLVWGVGVRPVPVCGRRPSGASLAAGGMTWTPSPLAASCDVFYIGGTKVGSSFQEAYVVILNDELKASSRYHIKQQGGMLAKGPPSGHTVWRAFAGRPVF